jgi:hypothetical protein
MCRERQPNFLSRAKQVLAVSEFAPASFPSARPTLNLELEPRGRAAIKTSCNKDDQAGLAHCPLHNDWLTRSDAKTAARRPRFQNEGGAFDKEAGRL